MPGVSRGFHYWQPAPRLKYCPHDWHKSATQPWAPTPKERNRHPSHWKTSVEKKQQRCLGGGEGGGGGENGRKKPAQRKTARANESHGQCSQLLGMCMPKTADSQLKWFGISSGLFISYESTLNLRIKL